MEIFKLFGSIFVDSDAAEKSIAKTGDKADGVGKKLGNGIKTAGKWGAAIAGGAVVAAGAIGALATPLVKAAANATAMNAQFEQVFGDMQKNAQKTIDGLGVDFGMLPNRIKPAFSQMTSMFKGLGMDTETAMDTAKSAVTLTADAAAFYDKSFEDANSALNSFIKGNYEGGEAIGLFGSAATMAAYASDELGQDWKTLDEAGKQVVRLKFAESMQESAGATGQAARESNSLENQLGNLKQAWEDIKAKFGAPILEPAVNMIAKLAESVQKVDVENVVKKIETFVEFMTSEVVPKVSAAFTTAKIVIDEIITNVKAVIDGVVEYFRKLTTGEGNIGDSFKRVFESIRSVALPILQDAFAFIKKLLGQLKKFWDENGKQISDGVKNAFAVIADIIGFVMPVVKFIIEDAWNAIKNIINGALNVIMGVIKVFAGLFTGDFGKMWEGVKQLFFGAIEAVWGLLQLGFLGKIFKVIKIFGGKAIDIIVDMVSKMRGKFDDVVSAGKSRFEALKDAIMKPINAAKDSVKGAIDTIKGYFTGLKLKLPTIKAPHFKLKNWSVNPLDWVKNMPSIGIDWYAKGALFTKPTIFNTPQGIKGFGEAGPEAALPLTDSVLGVIGQKIADTMDHSNEPIIKQPIILQTILNGRIIAEEIHDDIGQLMGGRNNLTNAMRGV